MAVAARWPRPAALLAAGLLANLLVAAALALRGGGVGSLVAALPIVVLAFAALVVSERPVLLGAALVLGLTISYLNVPLPIPGGKPVYAADVVAATALAAAAVRGALNRRSRDEAEAKVRRPAVLGWPFVLFSGIVVVDLLRGHARYGQTLFGQPARFIFFAGIAGAILHLNARQVHRTLTVVFYGGAGWMLLNAMYYIATGTHQTDQTNLSTGGTRWLSLSVAMLVAGSLFLAILNLSIHTSARLRLLDFAVAGVALLEIALAQGRATFLAVVVVLPFLFLLFRGAGRAVLLMLPLTLPILIVAGFIVVRAAPTLVPTLVERIGNTSSSDLNVRWRLAASTAVLQQYHESPLTGVGFGRMTTFQLDVSSIYGPGAVQQNVVSQDAHDGYVFLLAAGGIALFSSFLLLLATHARDTWLRLRGAVDAHERVVIVWGVATLVDFLINIATEPFLSDATMLLAFWALLLIPAVVPRRRHGRVA